ncbi:HNH endonuclease signature motif containing protein [Arthrobacter sp. zg-Y750]|uniref:HNH endonuclease signature motif containing protein n=1 Tax=Arthrobacter sp. zg-Y750 TaxID=2894189 RepID=UPI001E3E180B|nr:HNH endonuclease signature motif containing protein [Arthrobacter sp. zg-Y750]MCC9176430.1 HNH endonuclease [Arthrobacter sp. zg-Y750]
MTAEPVEEAVRVAHSSTVHGTELVSDAEALLEAARGLSESMANDWKLVDLEEAVEAASVIEDLSRITQYLQVVVAGTVDRHRPADTYGVSSDEQAASGKGTNTRRRFREFRSTADFLRARLRISRAEAKRRLGLAAAILPTNTLTGRSLPPSFPRVAESSADGVLSAAGVELIVQSLEEAQPRLQPDLLDSMEKQLVEVGAQQDHDFLLRTARHWLALIDQETPPGEEELARFQGIFAGRRRNGLNHLHVYCTDEQHEALTTAMNGGANPRVAAREVPSAGITPSDTSSRPPEPSRPQQLLEGLLGAIRAGLATGGVPASGGLRPQVMVTISHDALVAGLATRSEEGIPPSDGTCKSFPIPGAAAFSGPIRAEEVRRLACDADLIPAVLGSAGQVLDLGRATRLFPPHLRKALHARDRGCTFPGCTVPGPWTEAHHVTFWERGGGTSIHNGALLCSFHHHLIHQGNWQVSMQSGIPWFRPPAYVDPDREQLRNTYFHPEAGSQPGSVNKLRVR